MPRNFSQAFVIALTLASASPSSRADAVADWNRIALDAVVASSRSPEQALQALATVHTAMFEALNFVEPRYKSQYTVSSPGQPGVARDAIAAGAANTILHELYPARAAIFRQALKKSLNAIENQQAAYAGAITGRSIAQIVWAVRSGAGGGGTGASAFYRMNSRSVEVEVRSLNSAVAGLIASRKLDATDSARIHALAAMAGAEAMSTGAERSVGFSVGVAVQSVFGPSVGSQANPQIATSGIRARGFADR